MENIVGGRFNIVEILSRDRAFRAFDTQDRRQVFIKRFRADDASFEYEKRNLNSIVSPHIAKFDCAFEEEGGKYIVTEWISGISLAEYVRTEGTADREDAGEIIVKVCEALSFIHWNRSGAMAYLDLKPSNIMLRNYAGSDARRMDVCFVDLEAARSVEVSADAECAENAEVPESGGGDTDKNKEKDKDKDRDKRTLRLGSPYYTAPEVLFGRICVQSDIYSLGVLTGYLLTGREDFPSAYSLRGFWGEFIARCSDPDPGKRYQNVSAVIEAVREQLSMVRNAAERKSRGIAALLPLGQLKNRAGNDRKESVKGADTEKSAKDIAATESVTRSGDSHGVRKIVSEAINFRRSCVMVEGNPCFVCEMGSAAAGMGLRTGVFSLTERGRRDLEYDLTGREEDLSGVAEKSLYPYVFDHKSMYLHSSAEWAEKGLLKAAGEGDRLYTGTFKQYLELPMRRAEDVRRFVEWCMANFDLTIMNTGRGDDAALIGTLLENCSYVIATPDSNVEDMEAFRDYYMTLAQSGKVIYSKVRYVAWDYADKEASRDRLFQIVGRDKYLGEVFRSETRSKRKNRISGVSSVLDDTPGGQYEEILQRLIS